MEKNDEILVVNQIINAVSTIKNRFYKIFHIYNGFKLLLFQKAFNKNLIFIY